MLHQLEPSIPVYISTKKKTAQAIGWIDYGKEENLYWICALDDGGEVWIECNCNIRLLPNYTIGRTMKRSEEHTSELQSH